MVKLTDFFKKKDSCRPEDVEALRQRYGAFRSLLEENREILEIITDLEEKRHGDYLFDMQYLRSNVRRLSEKVYSLIRNLNEISGEGYKNALSGVQSDSAGTPGVSVPKKEHSSGFPGPAAGGNYAGKGGQRRRQDGQPGGIA